MLNVTPFLWFERDAEKAVEHYASIFSSVKVLDHMPGPNGSIMGLTFELEGQRVMALNGGPHYKLSPAFSFYVRCETQAEVDRLWSALGAGGEEMMCGWLADKFGVSWQIIPKRLEELFKDPDPARAQRAMQAMLKMKKIDIATLDAAANGA
ncbi:VOC family protein [Myxococcota bacterium]|nr:VOC family protein [Myxococcota bacterium]